jgi:hypothetical protein
MSESIKPPGRPPAAPEPSTGVEGTGRKAAEPFREVEELLPRGGAPVGPLEALAADLRAGRLTVDQAVERLLERAMEGGVKALSGADRAALERHLRASLTDDPTLQRLVRDLESRG